MAKTLKPERQATRKSARLQVTRAIEDAGKDQKNGIDKRKRFRRPRQRKSCRFLQLPGEIRNNIYRAALVDGEVTVTKDGPAQPALLKVCKQIRHEARGIYYAENDFSVRIVRYDGAPLSKFSIQHSIWSGPESKLGIIMEGRPNWENFLGWLKTYHQGYYCDLRPNLDDIEVGPFGRDPDDEVVAGMFEIVERMRFHSWAMVCGLLESAHRGVAALHPCWA